MKPRWLVSVLILLMASCGGTGKTSLPPTQTDTATAFVATSQVEQTEVALIPTTAILPSSTVEETPIPTTASFLTPIPAATQIEISNPAAIIAKVGGGKNSFLLVGGSQNGSWVSAGDVAGVNPINADYQLYTGLDFQGWITGQGVVYEPICDQHFLTFDLFSVNESAVGVSGKWSVMPRTPQEIPTNNEIYLQAVAAWQVDQAPSQPIAAIKKIWKVDVEGNGTDEVFINATHYAEPTGHNVEPRDYSVVLMRTVIGSEVVTIQLVGDYYTEAVENRFPLTYTLEFIGDLNGDGQMEVVVGVSRWKAQG